MKDLTKPKKDTLQGEGACYMNRRRFLLLSGAATAGAIAITIIPGCGGLMLESVSYARKKIGTLSALKQDKPAMFNYPDESPNAMAMLIKLGKEAGLGVGPKKDVVAFSTVCPHMGGPLAQAYKAQYKALGPCPLHLTTFDLRKHGMVVCGHSVESLPQIQLEVEGDDIYATGVMGLIYGYPNNTINNKS